MFGSIVLGGGYLGQYAPVSATAQKAFPSADTSVGTWTTNTGATTNLYQAIGETPASDADYIQSVAAPLSAAYTATLGTLTDPAVGSGHVVNVRALIDTAAGGTVSLQTDLLDASGAALSTPATWTDTLTASVQPFSYTLSTAQADAIPGADYVTGLQLRFTATQGAASLPTFVAAGTLVATATNNTSFTPVPPNGAVGDMLILIIERNDTTVNPTITGWANVALLTATNTSQSTAVYWKVATSATGSTDQTTVTFGTSTVVRAGLVLRFSGVSATSPIHLASILNVASTATTVSSTNITSTIANTLGVFVASMVGARSTTNTVTNWSTAFTSQQTTLGNDLTIGYSNKTFATAGSYLTPGITWTTNTTTGVGQGLLFALAPVANNSRAQVTWADLEVPVAAGGAVITLPLLPPPTRLLFLR